MTQTVGATAVAETELLAIVRAIFDNHAIELEDDFFDLGGNSITAIKLISEAERRFGEGCLEPDALFADGRLRTIAASISTATSKHAEPA